jgi:hypothetical protein
MSTTTSDSVDQPAVSEAERRAALDAYVAQQASHGWRVISNTGTQAQLVKGKPTNHVLHLLLTIFTLGLWAIVWILTVIFAGEKQRFVTVDANRNVHG